MGQANDYEGSLKAHFLIAMPSLQDPNFNQTVTYLCAHNQDGAVGLVINRVLPGLRTEAVFHELKMPAVVQSQSHPVHLGGPVHQNQIFVLHGPPFGWNASLEVTPTVAMTNSRDILEAIAQGRGPCAFLIVVGCAGWGPGQLESELAQNSWLTSPASDEILFEVPVDERWQKAATKIGINLALLSDTAGHA